MIRAFSNALRQVYASIPPEILEAAFRTKDYQTSMDRRIQDVIISGHILPDVDVNCGTIKRIPLYACMVENVLPDPGYNSITNPAPGSLYRIPAHMRENRDVVGVIDLSFPYDYTGYNDAQAGFGINGNSVAGLAAAALDSHTHRNACLTPTPKLLENNLVLINPTNSFLSDWVLVCRLGYDEDFTSLTRSAVIPLGKLLVTAVKMYIWTNLTIRIDQAVLSNGQELGQFKAVVDSYSSAAEQYAEDLIKFRGSTMYDPELMRYLVRSSL